MGLWEDSVQPSHYRIQDYQAKPVGWQELGVKASGVGAFRYEGNRGQEKPGLSSCNSPLSLAHHSWEIASSAVIRWSCSTSISLVTRSLAGDKAREELRMGAPSHCLEVMNGLAGRSRIQQRS